MGIGGWAPKKMLCSFDKVFYWPIDEKEFCQAEPEKQCLKSLMVDMKDNIWNGDTH